MNDKLKAKTAEEIAEKYVRGNHDALTDNQEIKDMTADIEEYASIKAEQARREAINYIHIETHNKIVETRVELYKDTQSEIVDRKLYDLDVFIGQKADAAAGYGKEEA